MSNFFHQTDEEFQAALEFTAADSGFQPSLIEKDYFCSVVLTHLAAWEDLPLVFKGGTLLNKGYAGFYRLSEDLDFTISTGEKIARYERSQRAKKVGAALARIVEEIPGFEVVEPFCGFNSSTQYRMVLSYKSCLTQTGTIQIEVSQREEVVRNVECPMLQTLLVNSLTQKPALLPFPMKALGETEAYAEKVRAALTRKAPAIRDLFDIDFAARLGRIDLENPELLDLAAAKISLPGNSLVALDEGRLASLKAQLETQLRPVLRLSDYRRFDFASALAKLEALRTAIAKRLATP